MILIKISVGPPPGINIRNLVWHGFISENEFPKEIISLVFAILFSISNIQETQLPPENKILKKYKNMSIWLENQDIVNSNIEMQITEEDMIQLNELIHRSAFPLPGHISLWTKAIQYLKDKNNY